MININRDEHIMLLKFLHLLFSKLFPEMKQLNMLQIAVLEVQRHSTLIEQSPKSHPSTVFLVVYHFSLYQSELSCYI